MLNRIIPTPTGFIYGPATVSRVGTTENTVIMHVETSQGVVVLEVHQDGRVAVDAVSNTPMKDINKEYHDTKDT